jgi:thiol-disulfide isomerase/thioredoxin
MKKFLFVILSLALFYLLWASLTMKHNQIPMQIGREIHLKESQKESLSTNFDEKKPLALYFMASWCHTCHAEYQALKQLNRSDRQWIAVFYFDNFISANAQYPDLNQVFDGYIVDQLGELSLDWGVKGTPEILLFDQGRLTERLMRVKEIT